MRTAEDYRAEAAKNIEAERESFERCDTDGYISQACYSLNAKLASARASILENDGKSLFIGLYQGERRVKAKMISTQFGYAWVLDESETDLIAMRGKPYLPTGKRSRVLKQLGLQERQEHDLAWAVLDGEGKGFSGLGNVFVKVYRKGDAWGADATLAT